jgi:hypothetical protein
MSQSDQSEMPPNTTKFNCGLHNTASHFASLHRNAQYEIHPDRSFSYIPGTPVLDKNPELYVDPEGKVNGFIDGYGGTRISTRDLGNEKDRFTACTQDRSKVRLFIGVDLPGISKTDDGVSALNQNKPNPYLVGIHTVQFALSSDSCQGDTPTDSCQGDTPTDSCQGDTPTNSCQGETPTNSCQGDTPTDSCQGDTPADKLPWVYGMGDYPSILPIINKSVNSELLLPAVPPDSPSSAPASTIYPSHSTSEIPKDESDM